MFRRTRVLRALTLPVATAVAVLVPAGPSLSTAAPVGRAEPAVAQPASAAVVTRHVDAPDAVTAGTTITTSGGASYAFSSVVAGRPVRWNPCATLHWRANVMHAPVGGLDVLKAAVASIGAATGTTWVFDGTTTAAPASSWLPSTSTVKPVLVGWTDGTSSDLLRNQPASVLGMTRTVWFGHVTSSGTVAATRGAVVALDRTNRLPLRGTSSWSAVALHELGHAMGLAHPHDSGELMNAVLPSGLSGLQAGDRKGLYYLGRSQGCIHL